MAMLKVKDDRNRDLMFGAPPKRIVSLVPSDTLSVIELGGASALVGRTDYCDTPADVVATIPKVGGTKNPDLAAIMALEPDLILANQEENTKSDLETLAQKGFRVYVAFPRRVADGMNHLAKLARILGVAGDPKVRAFCKEGYEAVRAAEASRDTVRRVKTFCPIWMDPLMTIHGDTFISDMLDLAGADNVFAERKRRYPLAADLGKRAPLGLDAVGARDVRYPRITFDELVLAAPELVVLPDEPHPFTDADAEVFRALAIPAAARGAIVKTSGKDLCWYGSQSVHGIARVRALIDSYRGGLPS
jgi:ABC-type Fe3+-hydroxamate transport system substrate-binding protein